MRVQVTMPQLGESVSEGTVTRWLCGQGDSVAADEPLLEIATDKVSMEVPSLQGGLLLEILVGEGETVPVGAALAWLEVEGKDQEDQEDAPAAGVADGSQRRPSPLIRRLLQEAGLTAAEVAGSGANGRIMREDIAAAVRAARDSPPPGAPVPPAPSQPTAAGIRTQPLTRTRAVIAERMVTSLRNSAELTSVVEVDVSRVAEARMHAVAEQGLKLSFLPFFAKAAVEALESHEDLNASVDTAASTVTHHRAIHLAVAVDTARGLLAPVIRDAGRLSLIGLADAIAGVAARTRDGSITADELSGGTFTLTNTGSRGALFDTPIINQPQVAILATGAVVRRPVVVTDPAHGGEGIAIRSMAYLALTYDHRLIDGALAAHFLMTVKRRLEDGRFESALGLAGPMDRRSPGMSRHDLA